MDTDDFASNTVVDPEIRAYVFSLVSALGGTGADELGRYILGDDALACLKDIKKWLKLYDEKTNRLDVARCLAEANLVNGDLLGILSAWPEDASDDKLRSKIALASLELLVPLTWPIEKDELGMTKNHHRHIPYLQLAQLSYKRSILEHDSSRILRTVVRIGLPSIALPITERSSRDEGIIKLMLYFFRNVALISAPNNLPIDWDQNEVSRSATIEAFHHQDVLALLLTIASNMGEDFTVQDVVIMEVLFHLVKGVRVEKLFMNDTQRKIKKADELKGLINKEAGMHRHYAKHAPTRHNRFGTMIWLKRDDARVSTVTGQDVLTDNQLTLLKMDQSKKWNRPKQRSKNDKPPSTHFDLPTPLSVSATEYLRRFVEEFLDSSFNPLFNHIRRAIEREADRVLEVHNQQYFYLVSWFLEAERVRRKSKKEADQRKEKSLDETFETESFSLIASVLNQETFILLNRFMQDRLEASAWPDVNAGMRCFIQILLTVQEMSESALEEDQEIAENIQNRIFYDEETHDRIPAILRGYKNQGFSYLDACTELSHVFLRMLERYSKENVDLQIRSKRRARKKKGAANKTSADGDEEADQPSEAEDINEAQRIIRERKFDFSRFASKLVTQGCVDTFVTFTTFYKDLNLDQLKRAHRYFYRVAFKQEMSVLLFRLDIIALLNKMVKGPESLDSTNSMYREWEELTRQLDRRLIKKLQQRPEMAVELLFSKISSTAYYLEYGHEKQNASAKPRAAAELEVKGTMTREEQIGVVVAAMHDEQLSMVNFVKNVLSSASSERQSWEAEATARKSLEANQEVVSEVSKSPSIFVKPDNDEQRIAMFKDSKLRLLMSLVGFERLGIEDELDSTWIIPSAITSTELQETHDVVERHQDNPIMFYGDEDPVDAEDMLQRKRVVRKRKVEYDDDSDGDGVVLGDDEEFLFPAGGPTNRKSDALNELKKKRRRRLRNSSDDEGELDEETRRARRAARLAADLEKRRKIKSEEFVHDSDDEDNEERDRDFFAREELIGKTHAQKILHEMNLAHLGLSSTRESGKSWKRKSSNTGVPERKRAKPTMEDLDGEEDNMSMVHASSSSPTQDAELESSEREAEETPLSSPRTTPREYGAENPIRLESPSQDLESNKLLAMNMDDVDKEEVPIATMSRRRAKGVILDDSESE